MGAPPRMTVMDLRAALEGKDDGMVVVLRVDVGDDLFACDLYEVGVKRGHEGVDVVVLDGAGDEDE
jgi:hypothetical protein